MLTLIKDVNPIVFLTFYQHNFLVLKKRICKLKFKAWVGQIYPKKHPSMCSSCSIHAAERQTFWQTDCNTGDEPPLWVFTY